MLVALLTVFASGVRAGCPDFCNGHGNCDARDGGLVCSCFDGWSGPSCASRKCDSSPAWISKGSSLTAHGHVEECSGAGVCDRTTGLCKCNPGFSGMACHRLACPNGCSGRGTCSLVSTIGAELGSGAASPGQSAPTGFGWDYSPWDKNMAAGCNCEYGAFGPDCSLSMCPRAANPSATSSTDYTVVFTVQSSNSSGEVNGTVGIFFAGQQATLPMPANLDDVTSDYCKLVFESLPNVRTVSCSKSNHSGSSKSFAVSILEWATVFDSYMNNIWYHDGAPTLESWACDTRMASAVGGGSVNCGFGLFPRDIQISNSSGFQGSSDVEFRIQVVDTTSVPNLVQWSLSGSGSLSAPLQMSSNASVAIGSDGLLVTFAADSGHSLGYTWLVAGEASSGTFSINASPNPASTFQMCAGQGICDTGSGSCFCFDGYEGAACGSERFLSNASQNNPGSLVQSLSPTYLGELLKLTTVKEPRSDFFLISAKSGNKTQFSVRGDGQMFVEDLEVNSVLKVSSGDYGDLRITERGLTILKGGLVVDDTGVTVKSGGIVVDDDGGVFATKANDVALLASTTVTSGFTSTVFRATSSAGSDANYFLLEAVRGGDSVFAVRGDGKTIVQANGIEVREGGIDVLDGGVSISNDGLFVQRNDGNLALAYFNIDNAAYKGVALNLTSDKIGVDANYAFLRAVNTEGTMFEVRGDGRTTIGRGGLSVEAGGATIQGGTQALGGVTIPSGGLAVDNGDAIVANGRLRVQNGGATIASSSPTVPVLRLEALDSGFMTSVVNVRIPNKAAGSDFNIFEMETATGQAFLLASDGLRTITTPTGTTGAERAIDTYRRSRSVGSTLQQVQDNDLIRSLVFQGYSPNTGLGAADFLTAATLAVTVDAPDGTVGPSEMGGNIVFSTTEDGTSTLTERLSIGSTGVLQIGALASRYLRVLPGKLGQHATIDAASELHIDSGAGIDVATTAGPVSVIAASNIIANAAAGRVSITAGSTATLEAVSDIALRSLAAAVGTGHVSLQTGAASASSSGSLSIVSGPSTGGQSGSIIMSAGTSSSAHAGQVQISSGSAASGAFRAGSVSVTAGGAPAGTGGSVRIASGSGLQGGHVSIVAGSGDAAGMVSLHAGSAAQGTGGVVSLVAGESTGGRGGPVMIKAGGTTDTRYEGGHVSVSGASGAVSVLSGASTAGTAGSVVVSTGAATGGAAGSVSVGVGSTNSGPGGSVSVSSGSSTATGSVGGTLLMQAGSGDLTGGLVSISGGSTSSGVGGFVSIAGGSSGTGTGGSVVIEGGASTSGEAGHVSIGAGDSGTGFDGGDLILEAGSTTDTRYEGGHVSVSGASGAVSVLSGASTAGTAGSVVVSTGAATGGAAGSVSVGVGSTNSGSGGSVSVSSGSSTATGSVGGTLLMQAGSGDSTGGLVSISGGSTATGVGGFVSIAGGSSGTGTGGSVVIEGGASTSAWP
ncbi:hypothetical protein FNF29_02035 [Cafeteria roenbergensis]|uniref:EGF-like domain-containing protein n=1 Tax=Cafeteria roenbergensis TaxID=33653 RepID=A0A5A8CR10_CAFRO|nr:hypothetical protein FNF29_02035 [Cafeteria roenbergensis]|eukprot:KAA0154894.1 hypothetical protein FNF29_02035 [Cafeteria roenbergensis]